jgi:hypothetical protein
MPFNVLLTLLTATQRWNEWDPEERNITIGYSIGTLLVLYLANGLLNTIEPLPLLPGFLKLIGFSYSSWFFFRCVALCERMMSYTLAFVQ